MKELLTDWNLLDQIVSNFLEKVPEDRKLTQQIDKSEVLKYFKRGVVEARDILLTTFSKKPQLVYEMLELEGNKKFDPEAFFQLMSVVRKFKL